MRRTASFLILAALLLSACADHRISLSYGIEAGRRLDYRLVLRADITRTLADEITNQRVEATFQAGQEILGPLPGGAARARMTLDPVSLKVDGAVVNVGPGQGFLVILGPDGRVTRIQEEEEGTPEEALAPVGVERLLPRLRPVLPGGRVATGDTWGSDVRFTDDEGTFSLEARSRLAGLGEVEGHRAALVRTTYVSPVDRKEAFPNAVADLAGRDVGTQAAWFALDGFLVRAVGDSVGRYAVTFTPPGGEGGLAPVPGTLRVRLRSEMNLLA